MSEHDILFEQRGQIGLITLNRPQALNALNAAMCLALHQQLDQWKTDDAVKAVVIQGAGDKAFCAGGDVVSLYKSGMAYRDGDATSLGWREFFWNEYRMNTAIKEFPKPYIALLDGITMGGGVGISVHGSHRVATENTMLAMPETGLGLIPDVGGGWFMPRLQGEAGMYLALTGDRMKALETCALGITQSYVPSSKLDELVAALAQDAGNVNATIASFSASPSANPSANSGDSKLHSHLTQINDIFAGDTVEDILLALEQEGSEWAITWHGRLLKKSPTSMKVTFRQMRAGREMADFRDNMKMEFRIVSHIMKGHDFFEGVRAILLDKDNNPRWQPDTLAGVSDKAVAEHFASLGDDELGFE